MPEGNCTLGQSEKPTHKGIHTWVMATLPVVVYWLPQLPGNLQSVDWTGLTFSTIAFMFPRLLSGLRSHVIVWGMCQPLTGFICSDLISMRAHTPMAATVHVTNMEIDMAPSNYAQWRFMAGYTHVQNALLFTHM